MGLHERLLRSTGMTFVIRREYRPTEEDYLNVTLLASATEFPLVASDRMHEPAMKAFLIAMVRVRPDLVNWLHGPQGEPKRYFSREEREYAKALYEDFVLWRLKQTA